MYLLPSCVALVACRLRLATCDLRLAIVAFACACELATLASLLPVQTTLATALRAQSYNSSIALLKEYLVWLAASSSSRVARRRQFIRKKDMNGILHNSTKIAIVVLSLSVIINSSSAFAIPSMTSTSTTTSTSLEAKKADLTYVSKLASDASNQINNPVTYPRSLYPDLEPNKSGLLDVGDGHQIYYEECGNPDGVPAVFLHGGPGAGCDARSRTFFDPDFYKIVVFDQRGSGRSIPNASDDLEGSLVENTTPKLVSDIEEIRNELGIDKWGVVLGGSWGSTLALAYAQAHPDKCQCLVLRGVFLFGPDEVDYLFSNGGTFGQNPAAWESYCQYIEDTSLDWSREKTNLLGAYWNRLQSDDVATREAAAAAFVGYELSISKSFIDPTIIEKYLGTPSVLIPFAVMEVHYMINAGFMKRGQLLDNVHCMADHKHRVSIVHGRADYVCQPQAAWRLVKALKKAGCSDDYVELEFVSGAGHSDSEPGLADAMVRATDRFRDLLK